MLHAPRAGSVVEHCIELQLLLCHFFTNRYTSSVISRLSDTPVASFLCRTLKAIANTLLLVFSIRSKLAAYLIEHTRHLLLAESLIKLLVKPMGKRECTD